MGESPDTGQRDGAAERVTEADSAAADRAAGPADGAPPKAPAGRTAPEGGTDADAEAEPSPEGAGSPEDGTTDGSGPDTGKPATGTAPDAADTDSVDAPDAPADAPDEEPAAPAAAADTTDVPDTADAPDTTDDTGSSSGTDDAPAADDDAAADADAEDRPADAAADADADADADGDADRDEAADTDEPAPGRGADRPDVDASGSADGPAGSTVHLRVRTVDNATRMLRLPVDNATTALRIPDEARKPAAAGTPGTATTAPKAEKPAGPRKAAPTAERPDTDGTPPAAGDTATEDAPAAPAGPVDQATTMLRLPPELRKPAAKGTPKTDPADDPKAAGKTADKPAEKAAEKSDPRPAANGSSPDRSTDRPPVDNATTALRIPAEARKPAPAADAPAGASALSKAADTASPTAGKTPPVDPRLAMRDSREVAGAGLKDGPKPPVGPAPETKPLPQPAPAPEPPPLPAPAPVPLPENTIEAMEVLATLSARPDTPLRRAARRSVIWGVFLAFVLGVVAVGQLLRPLPEPTTSLDLSSTYTFGGEQLRVDWPAKGQAAAAVIGVGPVGTSGEQTPVSIASVTKVMNAYLILKAHPLKKGDNGPDITVDKAAAGESTDTDQSRATLTEGQKLSEYQALELLMLPSANNVARLLARWDSGTEDAFVKKMNDQAAAFGMTNTVYADPAGYNDNTKSTATDQLKLAEQVMKDDVFRQIVAEPEMRFNGGTITNTNHLVWTERGSVIGTKTGSSTAAQSALMWAAVKEIGGVKRTIVGVTLRQPAVAGVELALVAQAPSLKIIKSVQNGLNGQVLARKGQVVGHVGDGLGGTVPVVADKDLTVAGWSGITAHLTLDAAKLGHTEKAGTQVGTLSAGDGEGRTEVSVSLQRDLAPPSILSRLVRLF